MLHVNSIPSLIPRTGDLKDEANAEDGCPALDYPDSARSAHSSPERLTLAGRVIDPNGAVICWRESDCNVEGDCGFARRVNQR